MRFKTDENLSEAVAQMLRTAGHDAFSVFEQEMSGSTDEIVSQVVKEEQRTLITLDMDFANIRAYPPEQHFGIVVLRPSRQDNASILALLNRCLPVMSHERLVGRLWIIEDTKIRIRSGMDDA